MKYLLFIVLTLSMFACQSDKAKGGKTASKNSESIVNLPPMGDEVRMELFRNTIAIDIIAYHMQASMSYNDKQSMQGMISFISPQQGVWKGNCKSAGRMSFMYETGVGREAEMLIHDGCGTLVWIENEKKVGMNLLTPDGVEYLNRFLPADGNLKLPEGAQPKQK